jgi:hypothetical protein
MAFWTSLFGGKKTTVETGTPPSSIASLRLQVFSSDYFGMQVIEKTGSKIARRPLAAGLVEAVVEDLGAGERMVTWDALAHFGKSQDELFEIARRQAAAKETEIASQVIEDNFEVLISNGFYLSAHLLDSFAKRDPKDGVLFVPLSWHHWVVHIINPMSVAPMVPLLKMIAESVGGMMKVTAAETLNTDVYWYKPSGVIEKLEIVGDRATSPELAKILER